MLGIGLAACSSTPAAPASSTTTTTTTLPAPITLSGTSPQGSYSSLGAIARTPVPILAKGALVPPPTLALLPYAAGTIRVAFRQFGSGPDLVLVMGQHGTMTWWDPQLLTDLAGHFTVTIFDLPGVGYSAPLPFSPSAESYSDVVAGLIYSLQLTRPIVLGWGFGGAVATALAERHPGDLSHLVLVDSQVGGSRALEVPKPSEALLSSPAQTVGSIANIFFPSTDAGVRQGFLARTAQLSPDDIVASGIKEEAVAEAKLASDDTITAGLRKLAVPSLVVDGTSDGVVPPANSQRLAALLPKRKLDFVAGAGYGVLVQDEPALVTAIVNFAAS